MTTFDQELFALYMTGLLSRDDAVRNADSRNNVALQIRLTEEAENRNSSGPSSSVDDLRIPEEPEETGMMLK